MFPEAVSKFSAHTRHTSPFQNRNSNCEVSCENTQTTITRVTLVVPRCLAASLPRLPEHPAQAIPFLLLHLTESFQVRLASGLTHLSRRYEHREYPSRSTVDRKTCCFQCIFAETHHTRRRRCYSNGSPHDDVTGETRFSRRLFSKHHRSEVTVPRQMPFWPCLFRKRPCVVSATQDFGRSRSATTNRHVSQWRATL